MRNHSAIEREETPHTTQPTQNHTLNRYISVVLRRRAESIISNRSMDPQTRNVIRYALETNDSWLARLVRRAEAGESLFETDDLAQTPITNEELPTEEKVEALADIICRSSSGDDIATRSAALLVLIAAIESSPHPRDLAAVAKQLAFTRCAELNVCGMVESQIAMLEGELFEGHALA